MLGQVHLVNVLGLDSVNLDKDHVVLTQDLDLKVGSL